MNTDAPQGAPDQALGCQTEELLVIHAVFRNALRRAPDLIAEADPRDAARIALIRDHLDEILVVLHNHHVHEDTLYWDLIAQRAPHAREDIERMKRDHAGIETDVQHVRALLTEWAAAPEKKEPLREALLALQGKVLAHLDDEERSIMPVAAEVLTQAEWDRPALQGRKETPRNRLLISLGYLQRCAPTKALADKFWHKVPPPVRLLYRLFGKRKFEREWEALYGK